MRFRPLLTLFFLIQTCFPRDFQHPRPIQLKHDDEKWAEKTLHKLSLEEKIGQMFMVRGDVEFMNVASPDFIQLRDQIKRYHLGGVLLSVRVEGPFLLKNQPLEAATFTNQLQQESKLPLIFAADFERGLSMRLQGVTEFPAAMAFGATGDTAYAAAFGQISGEEARAIGVQWNFFPIADVNSNPANPIINTRSFGEDPAQVAAMDAAYIHGARDAGMLTTAKHFPGHGDTSTDTHLGFARVDGDQKHIQTIELPPFQQAIGAGVDAVMVAHVTAPALDPDHIASLSPHIIHDVLREQLKFQGLVVPDALNMDAVLKLVNGNDRAQYGRYAVEAVKAGEDMLLLPADLDSAYAALLNAVHNGEIPESRIDDSVRRILRAKAEVGLNKARFVDIEALPRIIAAPEHLAFGHLVADAAVTLVRDNSKLLPLKATAAAPSGTGSIPNSYLPPAQAGKDTVAVIFSDDVRTDSGRAFERELKARIPDAQIFYVDNRIAAGLAPQILEAAGQAKTVIAAVFLIPVSGKQVMVNGELKNTVDMTGGSANLLSGILESAADHTAVVALGTPYIAASFRQVQNYLCTFSATSVSEVSAIKALFGEIPIRGHLPVTIPGIADRGAGLTRPEVAPARSSLFDGGTARHANVN